MKKILLFSILLCAAGCVSIPKETVVQSVQIGGMIENTQTSYMVMLDKYEIECRGNIDSSMTYEWIPDMLKDMVEDGDLWGKTCDKGSTMEVIAELQDFILVAARLIYAERKRQTDELDKEVMKLREEIRVEYATLKTSNQVVTRNLRSTLKYNEFIKRNAKKIVD